MHRRPPTRDSTYEPNLVVSMALRALAGCGHSLRWLPAKTEERAARLRVPSLPGSLSNRSPSGALPTVTDPTIEPNLKRADSPPPPQLQPPPTAPKGWYIDHPTKRVALEERPHLDRQRRQHRRHHD